MHCSQKGHTYRLLRGIGIIETDDHLALVHLREVLVKHRRLRMADVQVPAWLRRETGDNLALFRILQTEGEGRRSFVGPRFGGLGLCKRATLARLFSSEYYSGRTGEARNC